MALRYDYVTNAPVLRQALTSGSLSWVMTNLSFNRTSNTIFGNNLDGTPRPIEGTQQNPQLTATLEVLNSIQAAPELLCEYTITSTSSGSYSGTIILKDLSLSMSNNAVSTYSATFEYKSGSFSY
jgi:ribosome-binding ATPase YchF (GTP1/OBG family)